MYIFLFCLSYHLLWIKLCIYVYIRHCASNQLRHQHQRTEACTSLRRGEQSQAKLLNFKEIIFSGCETRSKPAMIPFLCLDMCQVHSITLASCSMTSWLQLTTSVCCYHPAAATILLKFDVYAASTLWSQTISQFTSRHIPSTILTKITYCSPFWSGPLFGKWLCSTGCILAMQQAL